MVYGGSYCFLLRTSGPCNPTETNGLISIPSVEVYLGLTPDENTRLKRYSVNKQLLAEGHLIAHRDK